jgi:spermidine synthase
VQLHHIYERDFATVLHTLRRHFAHVALFYGGGQGIIVASQQPFTTSHAHLAALQALPRVSDVIPFARPLPSLLDDMLLLDDGLDRYIAGVAQRVHRNVDGLVSTDDNIYLEYATPKGNILPWSNRELLVTKLKHYRDGAAVARLFTDATPSAQ